MTLLLAADPPDLARGRVAAPAWLILTVAGVVLAFAVGYLVLRFRRVGKGQR
ncbi:MAG: hypothetical protein QM820_03305 [Minicystis sp.]